MSVLFIIFIVRFFILHGFITNSPNDLLPIGLIAESWVRIPFKPEFFRVFFFRNVVVSYITAIISSYTAVSTKVVQKKRKSVRDNAERLSGKYSINFNNLRIHFVSFNKRKQVFIARLSNALKTRELDDATVNNHNPSFLSVLSRTL